MKKHYDQKATISRYFNPPLEIKKTGRKLSYSEDFKTLSKQLQENEVIIGLYMNRELYDVASHIHSQDRLNQIYEECLKENDDSYAPIEFYGIDKDAANQKLDSKIP